MEKAGAWRMGNRNVEGRKTDVEGELIGVGGDSRKEGGVGDNAEVRSA